MIKANHYLCHHVRLNFLSAPFDMRPEMMYDKLHTDTRQVLSLSLVLSSAQREREKEVFVIRY